MGNIQRDKAELNTRVANVVARMGKPYISGSSGKQGYSYLPIDFYGLRGIPCHRTDAVKRWDAMKQALPFKDRKVVDLGCATGYFSFKAADAGASVIGVDYEPNSIEVCTLLKEFYNYKKTTFILGDVRENLSHITDVVFCMSVAQWVRIADGDEAMTRFLNTIAKTCKHAFIELPSEGGGGAAIPWLKTQADVGPYLMNGCGFKTVKNVVEVTSHAGPRATWLCEGC